MISIIFPNLSFSNWNLNGKNLHSIKNEKQFMFTINHSRLPVSKDINLLLEEEF